MTMMTIRTAITDDANPPIARGTPPLTGTIPIIGHLTRPTGIRRIRRCSTTPILGSLAITVHTMDIIAATLHITDTILTRMSIGGITVAVGMSHSHGAPIPTEATGEVKTDAHGALGA